EPAGLPARARPAVGIWAAGPDSTCHTLHRPRSAFEHEADRLRTFPDDPPADLRQQLSPLDDGEEVVAGKLTHRAGEAGRPVWKQNLRLAIPARIEQDFPGRGIGGSVLDTHPDIEIPERHPS